MAYSELIKNFNRIRAYLRSFYVQGFRHRDEFTQKSLRSYDNERRRVESWLGDYMSFGQDNDGRRVFLSVDSRTIPENPLYRAFRTKTFTDGSITLHFHILDILKVTGGVSITGMMDELADRLSEFESDDIPDESTVRKKLREYASLGLVCVEKRGRETFYMLSRDHTDLSSWAEAAAFFSEYAPLGVIGSFISDRLPERFLKFRFKHHYILNALDSEILLELFQAIGEKRIVSFTAHRQVISVLPLKVYIGTQTGRQYLLGWSPGSGRFSFFRTDLIDQVKAGDVTAKDTKTVGVTARDAKTGDVTAKDTKAVGVTARDTKGRNNRSRRNDFEIPADLRERLEEFCAHTWGVAGRGSSDTEHIEMTVFAGPEEGFIVERLEREKRCGTVSGLDETHWQFSADVYDALEMLPWLRTFTGRITQLKCSSEYVAGRFLEDVREMAEMYREDGNTATGSGIEKEVKAPGFEERIPAQHMDPDRKDAREDIHNDGRPVKEKAETIKLKNVSALPVFHEIYGSYYRAAASILREAVRGTLTGKKLNSLVQKYAFGESLLTIPDGMQGEKWRLLHKDLSTPLEEEPAMPLTLLEKRWMKSLLTDPRIRLFEPDSEGLEDVEPLFTPDMIVYYDRYANGDDFTDPDYIQHFRTICQALREGSDVRVSFETRLHAQPVLSLTPYYLEYSEKDDRFRLIASGSGKRWHINLSRIISCELTEGNGRRELPAAGMDTVTFELEDRRNALERVLLHFSHLEKETKRLDDTHYRVTLRYDRSDRTEMVIRILSFGPVIKVTGPEYFTGLIRERIPAGRDRGPGTENRPLSHQVMDK